MVNRQFLNNHSGSINSNGVKAFEHTRSHSNKNEHGAIILHRSSLLIDDDKHIVDIFSCKIKDAIFPRNVHPILLIRDSHVPVSLLGFWQRTYEVNSLWFVVITKRTRWYQDLAEKVHLVSFGKINKDRHECKLEQRISHSEKYVRILAMAALCFSANTQLLTALNKHLTNSS